MVRHMCYDYYDSNKQCPQPLLKIYKSVHNDICCGYNFIISCSKGYKPRVSIPKIYDRFKISTHLLNKYIPFPFKNYSYADQYRLKLKRVFDVQEFNSFYAASLLLTKFGMMRDNEIEKIINFINEFACKLLYVTKAACNTELRHVFGENGAYMSCNKHKMAKFLRKVLFFKIGFMNAHRIFKNNLWSYDYGGDKWAEIAIEALKLKEMLPSNQHNLGNVIIQMDHIIDLEHNNDLYLNKFCEFNLCEFLSDKYSAGSSSLEKYTLVDILNNSVFRRMSKDYLLGGIDANICIT